MPQKTNILIIEDELLISEMLKETLLELNYNVVAMARNYASAIEALDNIPSINFCMIDINLNEEKTGFDIADKINSKYNIPFIFLTSYSDQKTIQEAVQHKPQAYLIKPFTKSDLFVTLEIYKSRNPNNEKVLEIKVDNLNIHIKHIDILWIKSENIYIQIQTMQKTYLIRNSLEKFLEKIDDENFIRIHRSYIANMHHIKAINRLNIIIQNEKLPVSRSHHDELVQRFGGE